MGKKTEGDKGTAVASPEDKLSAGLEENSSPTPEGDPPKEEEKKPEDQLAEVQEQLKQSESRRSGQDRALTAEKQTTKTLQEDLDNANKLIEELEAKELNAFEGDVDAVSVIKTMQENRRLKVENQRLEGQLKGQEEDDKGKQFEDDIKEVATAHNVDVEILRGNISTFHLSDKEGLENMAKLLVGKTDDRPPANGSFTPDSAISSGTPSFNLKEASSEDKIAEGLKRKKKK